MIMRCDNCGVTYDSAYGHYNCVPTVAAGMQRVPLAVLASQTPVASKAQEKQPILPADVIESWNLSYNVGVAVEKIGRFAFAGDGEWQHLEDAIQALRRELNRITGGNR